MEIAYLKGSNAMITSGLKEGDQVVVDGGTILLWRDPELPF